jgi:hypothetical protein
MRISSTAGTQNAERSKFLDRFLEPPRQSMPPGPEDKTPQTLGSGDITVYGGRSEGARPETVTPPPVLRLPAKDANRLPIGTRLSEFEITGVIGEGGFGIVYTAHDHSLDREVAIKEYMPTSLATRYDGITVAARTEEAAETFESGRRSFVNEARLLARFDHPSLLKVYRFWESNGTAYMAMPYYKGVTLKQRLKQSGAPNEEWLRAMLAQLLDALDVIHRENIFHRDIAPDNIFLLADDRPVLLDFGAARRVIGDMTHSLTVILKPGFAPVEQYADVPKLKQGPWTDLYALAAVIYFAVTGEKPLPSIGRYVSDALTPLAELGRGRYTDGFLATIDAALRVQPGDRPQNAAEFRGLLAGQPTRPLSVGAPATGAPIPAARSEPVASVVTTTEARPQATTEVATATEPSTAPAFAAATVSTTETQRQEAPIESARDATEAVTARVVPGAATSSASAPADNGRTEAVRPKSSPASTPAFGSSPATNTAAASQRSSSMPWIAGFAVVVALVVAGGFYAARFFSGPAPVQQASPSSVAPAPQATSAANTAKPAVATVPEHAPAAVSASPSLQPSTSNRIATAVPPTANTNNTAASSSTSSASPAAADFRKPAAVPTKSERLSRLLADAEASYSRRDYAKAQSLANQALALEPGNGRAVALRDKAQKAAWSEVQIQ